jgi:hypothetical protein
MSDDNPERSRPARAINSSFESLEAALEPWFGKSFGELPPEMQQRVAMTFVCPWDALGPGQQREEAQQWDGQHNPAFDHETEFWLEVPFRKPKLEDMKILAQSVGAPDAVALAVRTAMLFHIDEAIDTLPKDEEEVRSALPAEYRATIERVRRRWKEQDQRAGGITVDTANKSDVRAENSQAPLGAEAHPVEPQMTARRPAYTPKALAAWFLLRVGTWQSGVRPPTEAQCLEAATVYFEGSIPRDKFREIRRAKTSPNWRKPGPPSGR